MSRSLAVVSVIALTFPIGIDVPSDSTGTPGRVTRLTVAGGTGSYALIARDCEGVTHSRSTVSYEDVGAQLDQQIGGPLHVGIRGGAIREQLNDSLTAPEVRYANPYVALEGRRAGIGIGGVISKGRSENSDLPRVVPFSAHVRLGGRSLYLSGHAAEGLPLYSGAGFAEAGAGFHPLPTLDCWCGLTIGPYDGAGVGVKTAWQMHPRWTLDVSTRLGRSEGVAENAVGVAITSRLGGSSPQVSH